MAATSETLGSRLRAALPSAEPDPAHFAQLRAQLGARAEARRLAPRRRRALAAAAVLALVLLGAPPWEYVGSDGFDLSLDPPADRGPQSASNRRGNYAVNLGGGEDDAGRIARAEEKMARVAALEYDLDWVSGVTLGGLDRFQARVLLTTSRGPDSLGTRVSIPAEDALTEAQSETYLRFIRERYAGVHRAVRAGQARALAPADLMVDGRTVTMQRWLVQDDRYGPVVYWFGRPTR